jgi:hypothetical protein
VAVGVIRHGRLSSFAERADLARTVAPIKLVLGVILIASAVRIFYR